MSAQTRYCTLFSFQLKKWKQGAVLHKISTMMLLPPDCHISDLASDIGVFSFSQAWHDLLEQTKHIIYLEPKFFYAISNLNSEWSFDISVSVLPHEILVAIESNCRLLRWWDHFF